MLLPPDLRDWVPGNHLVHFIIDAVEQLDLRSARVNERGSGSDKYPPGMMLALLVYRYATGVFGSRRIEQSTYDSVAVRLLCGDTHPDHDTICTFRRGNRELLTRGFAQVLELAARCRILQVGEITVAIGGTKVLASASKPAALSYARAGEQLRQVELEIEQLLARADAADAQPLQAGLTVKGELTRRQARKARLQQARAEMEARAFARAQPTGITVLAAVGRIPHSRTVADLEQRADPPAPPPEASFPERMAHRTATAAGRARNKLRQQTVEPIFGVIKEAPGFRRFLLRGLGQVSLEWALVTLAYNLKHLYHLGAVLQPA